MSPLVALIYHALRLVKELLLFFEQRDQVLSGYQEKVEHVLRPKFLLRGHDPQESLQILNLLQEHLVLSGGLIILIDS